MIQNSLARCRVDGLNFQILNDNGKLQLGASQDLEIYHNGSNSYIDNHQGDLYIRGEDDNIILQAVDGENAVKCNPNGSVHLYYDGADKFSTTSSGVSVTGGITVSADSSFGHNIVFEDTKGIRLSHDNQTDGNDGTIAAGSFGSGLNIVGVQTQAGTGREVRMWGRVFPSTNGAEQLGASTNRWAKLHVNQILFNGDTAAANELDDYEEGTWTPTIRGDTGDPTINYIVRRGYYSKVGSLVHVWFDIAWNSKSGGTGNVLINQLPFNTGSGYYHGGGCLAHGSGFTEAAGARGIYANASSNFFYFVKTNSNSSVVQTSNVANNGHLIGNLTYRTGTI